MSQFYLSMSHLSGLVGLTEPELYSLKRQGKLKANAMGSPFLKSTIEDFVSATMDFETEEEFISHCNELYSKYFKQHPEKKRSFERTAGHNLQKTLESYAKLYVNSKE